MTFLFAFTCAYSLFNVLTEADLLSGKKYEAQDIEDLYAEKQSHADAALVSPALFSLLPDIIFEILPTSSTPNILFTPTFSVLRCWSVFLKTETTFLSNERRTGLSGSILFLILEILGAIRRLWSGYQSPSAHQTFRKVLAEISKR
jgi:hypothetical protein